MKLKNLLLTGLSFVLVATVAIGGTVAYLTSEDSDVNVMTVGNVKIAQHEYERVVNADGTFATNTIDNVTSYVLKDFTQAKPLLPSAINTTTWEGWDWDSTIVRMTQVDSYGGMQVFKSASNAQDKFVTVENTGKFDAYIRTLVAIEIGSTDGSLIGTSYHNTWTNTDFDPSTTNETEPLYIKIDGKDYMLKEYVYAGGQLSDGSWRHENGILPAGDTSYPNLSQVYIKSEATNEDMVAIDGNGNGTLDILVLSQAVQTNGFADAKTALDTAFGVIDENNHPWIDGANLPVVVYSATELQNAVDAAEDGDVVIFGADIAGDVIVTQKPNVKFTIDGNGKEFAGVITVDGKSATYMTAGLTIKSMNFVADSISADACIRLGNGENATRYTCNVTVSGCTFDVPGAVGVKSYTGGDKNLTISNCIATANAHSLVQAKGIDGVIVEDCQVYSKNGLNFNNSDNVTVDGCTVDVKGYAVRFGESKGGSGAAENYLIKNCSLKSANDDGDATIILRGTADNSTLTIQNTTIVGSPDIANTATGATVVQ